MRQASLSLVVAIVAIILTFGIRAQSQQATELSDDARARLQFENGLRNLGDRKYNEAIKDFTAVADSYPKSSVADNALVEMARIYFEVAGNLTEAKKYVDRVQTPQYQNSDATPTSYILRGRLALAPGRTEKSVRGAIEDFNRVRNIFPESDQVPEATFYIGETHRLRRSCGEAVPEYRDVHRRYSRSIWSARARLGAARCFVAAGRSELALAETQRVVNDFPDTPEAQTAVEWNTVLYRLYLRSPSYEYGDKTVGTRLGRVKDVRALSVNPAGDLFVVHSHSISQFGNSGNEIQHFTGRDMRALSVERSGTVLIIQRHQLSDRVGARIPLVFKKPGKQAEDLQDITGAVRNSIYELLVSDEGAKAIIRYTDGKEPTSIVDGQFARLAINTDDEIAALENNRRIRIFSRDGTVLLVIQPIGEGYKLDKPVDMAFDGFAHLFVLDQNRATVFVFSSITGQLITTFSPPEKSAGAFRNAKAIALDRSGRLFIYDEDTERVNVYE